MSNVVRVFRCFLRLADPNGEGRLQRENLIASLNRLAPALRRSVAACGEGESTLQENEVKTAGFKMEEKQTGRMNNLSVLLLSDSNSRKHTLASRYTQNVIK